jgi:peroxin-11B
MVVAVQLDASGIRPSPSAKRVQREAYRAWLAGLLCNAVAGVYTLWLLRRREEGINRKDGEGMVESKKIQRYERRESRRRFGCLADESRERAATNLQLVSDLCDMASPSTALGLTNFDEGIIGLAGTVSSLIGVRSAWRKTA